MLCAHPNFERGYYPMVETNINEEIEALEDEVAGATNPNGCTNGVCKNSHNAPACHNTSDCSGSNTVNYGNCINAQIC
jgi:hypothetical protein